MKLAELQRWLRWLITEPKGVTEALRVPGDREPKPRLLSEIVDAPPLRRESRLDIYAEAYFARLVDSLAKDFEAVHSVLDENSFRRLAADYLEAYPSKTRNIGEVGRNFPRFLQTSAFASGVPYLSALAELEWALVEAFYAENVSGFDPASLASLPPEAWSDVKLVLHPSVHLLLLNWPVDAVWRTRHEDDVQTELSPDDTHLLIYRQGFVPKVEKIDSIQWKLLELISGKLPLGIALERIQSEFETGAAAQAGSSEAALAPLFKEWFSHWVTTGIIHNVVVPRNENLFPQVYI